MWDIVAIIFILLGSFGMFFLGYGIGYINGSKISYPEILDNTAARPQTLSEAKKGARRQ